MVKIIIIGSGIGGSGIGALIAKETSHEITLFEQNELLGGRCASYKKKDDQGRTWIFDIGCHIFSTCDKGPLGNILDRVGKSLQWSYTQNPGPRVVVMGMDLSRTTRSKKRRKRVEQKSAKPNFNEMMKNMTLEDTKKIDNISLTDFLDEFFGKGKAAVKKMMYGMQAGVMFGVAPHACSAGEFVRCFGDNAKQMSMGYPHGGTGAIPEAYCQVIEENQGKIIKGQEGRVEKIIVENGAVKGVITGPNKTFHEADIVIANSDIKTTVLRLVGESNFSSEYVKYVKDLQWGGQVCSLKVGVDKVITDQKMLTYVPTFSDDDMKKRFTSLVDEGFEVDSENMTVPEKTVLLVVPISNHDPNLAPPGCQNIHVVSPTAFGSLVHWSPEDEKKWEQTCLNTMLELWPDLEDHIVIKDFVSNGFLRARFGKEGAGTGIAQSMDQVQDKRPSAISPIKGLYFSSADAGRKSWGIGTELPARAALDLFDVLQKYDFDNDKIFGTQEV
ncbi:MAG: phytoene desaturase family protein [Candidatus Helarchaeota archaeon]